MCAAKPTNMETVFDGPCSHMSEERVRQSRISLVNACDDA